MDNFFKFKLKSIYSFVSFIEETQTFINLLCRCIAPKSFEILVLFLKKHSLTRFNNLTELTVIDNPLKKNRFTLIMLLTSIEFNSRLLVNFIIKSLIVPSLSDIYLNANWSEREVRDMFGVYFTNNLDLRRLLTDYGFQGFPLRKDFPLTGYLEIRYDDELQRIIYEPVELSQEFRLFLVKSP